MKVNVRESVWETNSSMTHSIVVLPEDKYNDWKEGLYLYTGERWRFNKFPEKDKPVRDHLYTLEEVQDFVSKSNRIIYDTEEDLSEYTDVEYAEAGFYSFEEWPGRFENSETYYTTESGDKIVIRSYYGSDW